MKILKIVFFYLVFEPYTTIKVYMAKISGSA